MTPHFQLRKRLHTARSLCTMGTVASAIMAVASPLLGYGGMYAGMIFTFVNWAITAISLYALANLCSAAG
ncbi:hypothetical protein ACFSM5_21985 [Lacibacterium aquatile]|uniref:Uncharacterized protein n=1 Tax=Lacibacterium aquatile TaxID=1168082 RepID=A0ABW5E0K1_9PROT